MESAKNKMFIHASVHSKTEEICDKVVDKDREVFVHVSDYLKTHLIYKFGIQKSLFISIKLNICLKMLF